MGFYNSIALYGLGNQSLGDSVLFCLPLGQNTFLQFSNVNRKNKGAWFIVLYSNQFPKR